MNNTQNVHCRLCAELKPLNVLTNLQTDEETCQKVVNKLSRFNIVMDFEESILPKTVCLICEKSLEQAFTFVTAVEQAQTLLSDYIQTQTGTVKNYSYGEHTFYMPSDDDNEIIDIKVESQRDPMDSSDDNGSNIDPEEFNDENKDTAQPSVIVEEKMSVKNDSDEYTDLNIVEDNENNIVGDSLDLQNDCSEKHDINVRENDFNIRGTIFSEFKEALIKDTLEKENNSELIPPLNNIGHCTDHVNKQNHSTEDINTMDADVQHREPLPAAIPFKFFDTTIYSEEHINKQINTLCSIRVEWLKKTWMDYEWKCSNCGTIFSNIEELQTHSLKYHNSCNAYQCTDCKIKKQCLNAFIKHVRSHRKYLNYSCYKCFEKFPNLRNTLQHITKIHENSKYICLGCNSPFCSNTELDEHVNKHYKILSKIRTFIYNENLTCNTCNEVCANVIALKKHLITHKQKKRGYLCDRCGKCFVNDPKLRVHMDTHTERVLYQCEICKTTFKTVYSLRYHASIHSGIKPFACDVCSKRFRNKRQVTIHMKRHSDYFPITCTVCSKKFRTNVRLQNHMLQHTGEKPFSCHICLRDFTNLSNRNKHMRAKHGIEMAKKRQPIIKQQTADDLMPHLASKWENKNKEQKSKKANNRTKKSKDEIKELNVN